MNSIQSLTRSLQRETNGSNGSSGSDSSNEPDDSIGLGESKSILSGSPNPTLTSASVQIKEETSTSSVSHHHTHSPFSDSDVVARSLPQISIDSAFDDDDDSDYASSASKTGSSAISFIVRIILFFPNNLLVKPISYLFFIITYPLKLVTYLLFYRVQWEVLGDEARQQEEKRKEQSSSAAVSALSLQSSSPILSATSSVTSRPRSLSIDPIAEEDIEFEVADKGDDVIKSPTAAAPTIRQSLPPTAPHLDRHTSASSAPNSATVSSIPVARQQQQQESRRPRKKKFIFPRLLFNFDINHPPNMPKKTLVLDLDETLIHSLSRYNSSILTRNKGVTVEVRLNNSGLTTLYHIYKRPHVDEFLGIVRHWFNLVCFTASVKEYADPVINYLEEDVRLKDKVDSSKISGSHSTSSASSRGGLNEDVVFSQRFYRDSCIFVEGRGYVKDLSVLTGSRELKKSPTFGAMLSQTPSPSPSPPSSPDMSASSFPISPSPLSLTPIDRGVSRSRSHSRTRQSSKARNSRYTDLSKIVIIDNSPISYSHHKDNGIMIEGWINDPDDFELMTLLPLLNGLRFTSDVRTILSLKTGQTAFK
ncbi:DEKNAAC103595 [Brettanomyces naardenensis]|uniref:Mitochondrial import inner membrane translocase subunit TIM50 n=1 Tax=Brettanomyces naardenensis TaxID=13370 RepID=A0A448YNF5_BRENA|nr:DEKNAAC103595 [Brettanomyces naardenensis]